MKVYGQWPNIEKLLIAWLRDQCDVPVYSETPSNLADVVPCLSVDRFPGGYGVEYDKAPNIDITAWGANRGDVWGLVQSAETAMVRLNGSGNAFGYIDRVVELNSFGNVSYTNLNVRRAVGTYQLTVRPR